MIRVGITGATGRMGRMLIQATLASTDCSLVAAFVPNGDTAIGKDAGAFLGQETGVLMTDDLSAIAQLDVLIDFTRPEGTLLYLTECQKHGVAIVIGTTGFDDAGRTAIQTAAQTIPVVFAPNMSVGVNVAMRLMQLAGKLLAKYDCEIVEMHHKHKVDAPSGTALAMGRAVAAGRGVCFEDVAVLSREGYTGERKEGSIGFATLRGGDVVGDHTVIFAGPGERIELSHKSASREGYAQGSLMAARFLTEKKQAGLYDMNDVLNLPTF